MKENIIDPLQLSETEIREILEENKRLKEQIKSIQEKDHNEIFLDRLAEFVTLIFYKKQYPKKLSVVVSSLRRWR